MPPTTPAAPKFDADGNHWQPHGEPVRHRTRGNVQAPAGHAVDVHSYFNATGSVKSAAPFVLLIHSDALPETPGSAPAPMTFTHLTPDDARRFAAHLIDAANTADRALSVLMAQRTAATTSEARPA